tara:strand:- start:18 stop:401 length:384 start_codon:yes stop_codon:yes gene_type:complete
MLNTNEINILGNVINSDYGRSSADTYSCKALLEGNRLKVTYTTMAYFSSEGVMHEQHRRLSEESTTRLAEFISNTKDQFKEMSGTALKLEEMTDRDSLELANASMNSPRRVFVYRRSAVFEILNGSK